jgi:hypothetical protein
MGPISDNVFGCFRIQSRIAASATHEELHNGSKAASEIQISQIIAVPKGNIGILMRTMA